MIETIIAFGLSNAILANILAGFAIIAQAVYKRPHLARALWVLTLLKLVTPPVLFISAGLFASRDTVAEVWVATPEPRTPHSENTLDAGAGRPSLPQRWEAFRDLLYPWIAPVWFVGSAYVFALSFRRIHKFSRLLRATSGVASAEVQETAQEICSELGLRRRPEIITTSARISPMVWSAGRRTQIVLPRCMLEQMALDDWKWVLAHELCHVRRRDHWVRILEWMTGICFWWNPLVWWVHRNLRVVEEICCDGLVLSVFQPSRRSYAESIVKVIDALAVAIHPPVMACGIRSGGSLEERLEMILKGQLARRRALWLTSLATLCGVCVIPLGFTRAQDIDAVSKRLENAVEHRELSRSEADSMLSLLKKLTAERRDESQDEAKRESLLIEIDEAVKAGDLTEEQAKKRIEETLDDAKNQKDVVLHLKGQGEVKGGDFNVIFEDGSVRIDPTDSKKLQNLQREFQAAIKAGELSPEEAKKRLDEATAERKTDIKEEGDNRKDAEKHFAEAIVAFEAAVKNGGGDSVRHFAEELLMRANAGQRSQDDAKKRYRIRLETHVEENTFDDAKIQHIEKELIEAVKNGHLSENEAKQRMHLLLERKLEERTREFNPAPHSESASKSQSDNVDSTSSSDELASRRKKIMAAVDADLISKEDAVLLLERDK